MYKISSSDYNYLVIFVISEIEEERNKVTNLHNERRERRTQRERISNDNRKQIVGERNGTSRLSDLAVSENAWSATLDGRGHVGWKCLVSRHEKL